eukprot:3316822-Heterocapsa_arctica.AAC.1
MSACALCTSSAPSLGRASPVSGFLAQARSCRSSAACRMPTALVSSASAFSSGQQGGRWGITRSELLTGFPPGMFNAQVYMQLYLLVLALKRL